MPVPILFSPDVIITVAEADAFVRKISRKRNYG